MKKTILLLSFLFYLITIPSTAQNPKWFKKAAKAQITIQTFDGEDNELHQGFGFFVDKNGTAIADFELFKSAAKATVKDADGNNYEVNVIIGASSLYDLVKFRVKTDKETPYLTISERIGVNKEHVYILPYPTREKQVCLNDTLKHVNKFNEQYGYYTLGRMLEDAFLNSPVMDDEGEVIGLIQRHSGKSANAAYAISATYANTLHTKAMSATDNDLNSILIRKSLPNNEEEARTFLYIISSRTDANTYLDYLNEYVQKFPKSSDPFLQRADYYLANNNYPAAENDLNTAINIASDKANAYYTYSKLIYELNLNQNYTQYKDWDMKKAYDMSVKAYNINPLPLYIAQQGNTLYALKEYDAAAEKFISLSNTNMRSADYFLYAAQCKKMAQAPDSVILSLQDSAVACFTKPYIKEAAQSLFERYNTLLKMERYREAVLDMNDYEHLMLNDLTDYFYYLREQAEMKCRMFQQAVDDIDRAVRMNPNEAIYHAERAVVYYRIGEFAEALKAAEKSTQLSNDFADAYRIMGICQIELGDDTSAQKSLKKAADLGDESAQQILQQKYGN